MTVPLPANAGATPKAFTKVTRTVTVTPRDDDDAADNAELTVSFALVGGAGTLINAADTSPVTAPGELGPLPVDEDETQKYALTLIHAGREPRGRQGDHVQG